MVTSKTRKWSGNDAQRRRLCRSGFVLFVLLPTLWVAAWILFPNRHAAWESKLAHSCSLQVRLGQLTTLTPRHTLLTGVSWLEADLGTIAAADSIRVSELPERTVYTIERAEVRLTELSLILDRIQATAIRNAGCLEQPLEIIIKQLTLQSDLPEGLPSFTFDRVHLELKQEAHQFALSAQLFPAGTLDRAPIQFSVERHIVATPAGSQTADATDRLRPTLFGSLDTHEHSLPLGLLLPWWNDLLVLGSDCEFQGRAHWQIDSTHWDADVAGRLSPVDLTRLVADRFPRVLSGQAEIELTDLAIVNGKVEVLAGRFQCERGQIGQPFLVALQRELGLVAVADESAAPVPFQRLDLRFEVQGKRLGLAATDPTGYLMMDPSGYPLLAEGSDLPRRPQDLVRSLVGSSNLQVPLTRETAQIFPWLPLPDAEDLSPDTNTPPRGHLRLEQE